MKKTEDYLSKKIRSKPRHSGIREAHGKRVFHKGGMSVTSWSGAPNEEATPSDGIKVIAETAQPGCAEGEEKRPRRSS